jgi:hypothetical protein
MCSRDRDCALRIVPRGGRRSWRTKQARARWSTRVCVERATSVTRCRRLRAALRGCSLVCSHAGSLVNRPALRARSGARGSCGKRILAAQAAALQRGVDDGDGHTRLPLPAGSSQRCSCAAWRRRRCRPRRAARGGSAPPAAKCRRLRCGDGLHAYVRSKCGPACSCRCRSRAARRECRFRIRISSLARSNKPHHRLHGVVGRTSPPSNSKT